MFALAANVSDIRGHAHQILYASGTYSVARQDTNLLASDGEQKAGTLEQCK